MVVDFHIDDNGGECVNLGVGMETDAHQQGSWRGSETPPYNKAWPAGERRPYKHGPSGDRPYI